MSWCCEQTKDLVYNEFGACHSIFLNELFRRTTFCAMKSNLFTNKPFCRPFVIFAEYQCCFRYFSAKNNYIQIAQKAP